MFEELLRRIREVQNFPDGPVALHAPIFAGNEKRYVMDAIESTFVSCGLQGFRAAMWS